MNAFRPAPFRDVAARSTARRRAGIRWAPLALVAGLVLGGCRTADWRAGGELVTAEEGTIRFVAPAGWSYRSDANTPFFATRDGPRLQHLRLETAELLDPAPPREIAGALVESMRRDERLTDFSLCENEPATVAGRAGFRLVYTFRDPAGVKRLEARWGCCDGPRLVQLCFQAPARHYFQRDLAEIEATVRTLRLVGAPTR